MEGFRLLYREEHGKEMITQVGSYGFMSSQKRDREATHAILAERDPEFNAESFVGSWPPSRMKSPYLPSPWNEISPAASGYFCKTPNLKFPWVNESSKPHEDVLPNELFALLRGNVGQRFGFDPFGEVIDGYDYKFLPSLGNWECSNDIHPESSERDDIRYGVIEGRRSAGILVKHLACSTFVNIPLTVLDNRRPVIPQQDDSL
ncbi:unnamed protein product [Cuscuta campestris]|uniref:Uncharacterized protein n=1 Tax=Cuscuta campestris TaxID=132261 RepID=A0A484M1E2_9ASTE|nr:unnamed protein product [Cuscuta campestris]